MKCFMSHLMLKLYRLNDMHFLLKIFSNFFTESSDNSPNPNRACCYANTAECLSCAAGMSVEEYCRRNPRVVGCDGTELTLDHGLN